MDAQQALDFTDHLIYTHTGKHLNDLERTVFMGSWQGMTYEQIYPVNPQYVEKDVGYKLWQKLSIVIGEKVTKKQIRGAIARAVPRPFPSTNAPTDPTTPTRPRHRVFISTCHQAQDRSLVQAFYQRITEAGHEAVWIDPSVAPTPMPPNWLAQLDAELLRCDYVLLLLSPEAAASEMAIAELQRADDLSLAHQIAQPILMPIWVNCSANTPLSPDLRKYLADLAQPEWQSSADTAPLMQRVLDCLEDPQTWNSHTLVSQPIPPPTVLPPLSLADPEPPQGQVRLDSAFYIERIPAEQQCYREIRQPGSLIRIKAPRQMGKTSLMSRILYQARELGYHTVPLSFQHADRAVFASLDTLLKWFCSQITRRLKLPHAIDDHWSTIYGSKDNCTAYFEDYLLTDLEGPLVLGLDEVDRVFQYPTIADDFFGLLRAWYEEAGYGGGNSSLWEALRLVVVHSTEVYLPLDINQSPFNVGLPIELTDFSAEQMLTLAQRHGLIWQPSDCDRLRQLVGGHPYLVRLAMYHLCQHNLTLSDLIATALTEAGIYADHLRRHLWHLQQHPDLASAFAHVVAHEAPVELESVLAFKLHSLGLLQMQGNEVIPRFELYRHYFRDRLA